MLLTGCDEGRLYDDTPTVADQEGGRVTVDVCVRNEDTWSDSYTLSIAGFEDGNDFALISKNISPSLSDGTAHIEVTGIPAEVSTIALCALDRLRRCVTTFATVEYNAAQGQTAGYDIDFGLCDMSMAATIQRDIFNTTCVQCHGGSNHSAAGLNLTAGNSFSELIGIASVRDPERMRVVAGDSGESLLYDMLSGDLSSGWRYDHSVEVVRSERLELIRNWIDDGANPR